MLWGNLGAAAEAAEPGIEGLAVVLECRGLPSAGRGRPTPLPTRVGKAALPLKDSQQAVRLLLDPVPVVPVMVGHRGQDPGESRSAVAVFGRVVGAPVEWPQVRGKEDRHRPATASRHRLNRPHVDLIEIRPLLPVDLDVDEPVVHQGGNAFVFE